ncbi:MAG: outer membrane beta-barrel protein [Acidobacteriia bacterium]|nr:outer membrane beta-barrel protein [Terriglobia bacterium]
MKRTCRYLPLLVLSLACIPYAGAQSSVDFQLGFGTAHDKSTGAGIESDLNSPNAFGVCAISSSPTCKQTPSLSGFFLGFGADIMLSKHFGVGGEASVTPVKRDYGPLQFRQTFYDFNAILAPVNEKKVAVQLQGGIGGAKTGFSFTSSGCVGTAVCSTSSQPVGSSNHFQIHAGVGIQVYINEHVFIRPQFDLHYVPSFTDQFGSNVSPGAMVYIGYTIGDR